MSEALSLVKKNRGFILSPPVHIARWALMHHFPSVRLSLDYNSYLGKYYSYESETLPQYKGLIGAYRKNTYYTLGSIFLIDGKNR